MIVWVGWGWKVGGFGGWVDGWDAEKGREGLWLR